MSVNHIENDKEHNSQYDDAFECAPSVREKSDQMLDARVRLCPVPNLSLDVLEDLHLSQTEHDSDAHGQTKALLLLD